jgi:hypothetical protein
VAVTVSEEDENASVQALTRAGQARRSSTGLPAAAIRVGDETAPNREGANASGPRIQIDGGSTTFCSCRAHRTNGWLARIIGDDVGRRGMNWLSGFTCEFPFE